MIEVICAQCGTLFKTRQKRARFCSSACCGASKTKPAQSKICAQCGQSFVLPGRRWQRIAEQECCSASCAARMRCAKRLLPLREAFEALVDNRSDPVGCWPWLGSGQRYGTFVHGGKCRQATHVALELDGRPLPKGKIACHHCDNPPCVNPAHLYAGTNQTNAADAKRRNRLPRGEKHWKAKLTRNIVLTMRHRHDKGESIAELAREFHVQRVTAQAAIDGRNWRDL